MVLQRIQRSLTSYISRFLLILIVFSAVSVANAAAKPGGRLIVIRVANFGWNVAANVKIGGQTVAKHCSGSPVPPPHPGRAARSDYFGRAEHRVESADLDYCKRAVRHLHVYRAMGFGSRLSPADDVVARGDGEIGTLRSAI